MISNDLKLRPYIWHPYQRNLVLQKLKFISLDSLLF